MVTRIALNTLEFGHQSNSRHMFICPVEGIWPAFSLSSCLSSFPISDPPPAFSCILLFVSVASQVLFFVSPLSVVSFSLSLLFPLCPDLFAFLSFLSILFVLPFSSFFFVLLVHKLQGCDHSKAHHNKATALPNRNNNSNTKCKHTYKPEVMKCMIWIHCHMFDISK